MSARRRVLPLGLAFFCALTVLTPGVAFSQESGLRYYLSNELGMALEPVGWYRRDEARFVLAVQEQEGGEVRTLLQEGVEIKRWELQGREERVYDKGLLTERVRLDTQGRPLELWEYQAGSLFRRTEYSYSRSGEITSRVYDGDGELLYTDSTRLSVDRGLREIRRESVREGESSFALSMSGSRLVEERTGDRGSAMIRRYDAQGRVFERESWRGDRLAERETLRYAAEGVNPAASTVVDALTGRTTVRSYDDQGRLQRVEVLRDGQRIEQTHYERDGEGRTILATKRGPEGLEQWRYEYDAKGELLREEYRLRGSLVRITRFGSEGGSTEELYRDGALFLRVDYQDGEKVREEFLKDGSVIRTREYR